MNPFSDLTFPPAPTLLQVHLPDAKELLTEVLLNKQVLLSYDGLLRPAVDDATRVLEITGQPVAERKHVARNLRRTTRSILKGLGELVAKLSIASAAHIERGRPYSMQETRELLQVSRLLDRLGKRIDKLLSRYLALWQGPVVRARA